MKTVIFYSSTYNGNTLKIAESIAATLSADLIAIETKISDFDLSQYDFNRNRFSNTFWSTCHPIATVRFSIAFTRKKHIHIFHPLSSVFRQLPQNTEKYHKTEESQSC